ncbi:uncharacterized protein SPPG_00195 [Spizellomyces punctatus DAOM BR117]|uniref:Clathrin/coatomer adaptor adaptin-like N-terminal domain-containing protein n=1 Tax=Spizellomyces punctatus (strain DAOM BR117) TaxID=645134 RepID=A0A0L0HTN0_SPIPD|nr:uncharacterized protein SPPG_00195 [Spizellomyces punctatus DAOM BR117]KND04468.1 hypothetical protein SPPG_00195 [Spizellomyces punctatus DAOM BR117]|eukprot:XP_016612507.1 hypothetical protein SPPG_00195 [Spizellomyces punctatus DAOM BR117]
MPFFCGGDEGYLCVSMFLHERHELSLLMVNTLQRDLNSDNINEQALALAALCGIANADMISPLLSPVLRCLRHENALVRKRAAAVIRKFSTINPTAMAVAVSKLKRVLADQDPGVMSVALTTYRTLLCQSRNTDTKAYLPLLSAFIHIHRQAINGRLATQYDFHGVTAPWIQLDCLEIIGTLGACDMKAAQTAHPVILDTLENAQDGGDASYAIIYGGIKALSIVAPVASTDHLGCAPEILSRLLQSANSNLRYLGLAGLYLLVGANVGDILSRFRAEVEESLRSGDDSLEQMGLKILCLVATKEDYHSIVDHVLDHLRKSGDACTQLRMCETLVNLLNRLSVTSEETCRILFQALHSVHQDARPSVISRLNAVLLQEDAGAVQLSVKECLEILVKDAMDVTLLQFAVWVLSEFITVPSEAHDVLDRMGRLLNAPKVEDLSTTSYVLQCINKLVQRVGTCPPVVISTVEALKESPSLEIQQRCHEFFRILASLPNISKSEQGREDCI